jgi:glycosyltransferase involved in cell wall biosynthesis
MDPITIGITCFNAEASIERAVRSARDQTWEDLEIVAVDDRSTDGSWAILERLAAEDDRLRIVRHPKNNGVGAARNTVLEHATGDFVAFFDDDDVSRPERLAEQHDRIVDYERVTGANAVVCYSATDQMFPDGTTRYSPTLGMDETPAPAGEEVARLILLGKPVAGCAGACPTSAQMARRTVLQAVGGFDAGMRRHEDTDLNLRLALAGAHFAGMSKPLVVQTITVTGDKTIDEERRYAFQLIEKHWNLLEQWNWHDFSRRWTEMKYSLLEGGVTAALPRLVPLLFKSPFKLAQKAMWSLPNRGAYKRYDYQDESTG